VEKVVKLWYNYLFLALEVLVLICATIFQIDFLVYLAAAAVIGLGIFEVILFIKEAKTIL